MASASAKNWKTKYPKLSITITPSENISALNKIVDDLRKKK